MPSLSAPLRAQVRLGVQAERRARAFEAELSRLRAGVEVVVAAPDADAAAGRP